MRNRLLGVGLSAALCVISATASAVTFKVSYPSSTLAKPFSGRVLVFLTQKPGGEPRLGPDWFNPEPFYSITVKNLRPGQPVTIESKNAIGFPGNLTALPNGDYRAQAVFDLNLGGRQVGSSPGNLYSKVASVTVTNTGTINLECDQIVTAPKFVETNVAKEFILESSLLTKFYGRPTAIRAAVILPPQYDDQPSRKFPVLYEVPGFGGNHYMFSGSTNPGPTQRGGQPFIYVVLNPDCPTGHSVFADSANNGPWGKALTSEFIPALESKFRALNTVVARFITGHSSGGWSSLWLQVTYPDVFGGVWSTSPDPVDFRDFQQIDLYDPKSNMFTDPRGKARPIARIGTQAKLFYRSFSDMERPLGRGEQLGSFDAVFSPRGIDGLPKPLWNRDTGAIDQSVATAWQKYDIALTLRKHWKTLGPKLEGKIHLYMGDLDTFYLEGATKLLKRDLARLGSDAVIEIVPGDHFTMMSPALRSRMDNELARLFRSAYQ
jgi:S-formylglutathione hydrolase FrmB